jgi:hypothetical protein
VEKLCAPKARHFHGCCCSEFDDDTHAEIYSATFQTEALGYDMVASKVYTMLHLTSALAINSHQFTLMGETRARIKLSTVSRQPAAKCHMLDRMHEVKKSLSRLTQ